MTVDVICVCVCVCVVPKVYSFVFFPTITETVNVWQELSLFLVLTWYNVRFW